MKQTKSKPVMRLALLLFFFLVCIACNFVSSEKKFLLIKGGTVVNANEEFEGYDVLINSEENTIVGLGLNLSVDESLTRVIDAKGKYVMPGGVDPHVHMELAFMGTVSADDHFTATRAALAGGTTTVIDFAPPDETGSILNGYEKKKRSADAKVCSDYSLHVIIKDFNEKIAKEMEILGLERKEVNSFKFYMSYKNDVMVNDERLYMGFQKAKQVGAICMVHAENGEIIALMQKKLLAMGITGPEGHGMAAPPSVEAEAVHRAATIAEITGTPLYIVHVMSRDAMEEVMRAKLRGVRIVGEPVLSGLTLEDSQTFNPNFTIASTYIMSPPLRRANEGHREALRNGLKGRILDLVATDHCVFNTTQKKMGKGDFTKIPNGIHGVEDRMNILWDLMVRTGEISPMDYVRITSTEAAQIFNIYPRKGVIRAGSDADVIILNPKATKTISASTHFQNIDFNLFEGRQITGVVETTISRGRVVFENGKMNVKPGIGRFIPNPPFGKMFKGLELETANKAPKRS